MKTTQSATRKTTPSPDSPKTTKSKPVSDRADRADAVELGEILGLKLKSGQLKWHCAILLSEETPLLISRSSASHQIKPVSMADLTRAFDHRPYQSFDPGWLDPNLLRCHQTSDTTSFMYLIEPQKHLFLLGTAHTLQVPLTMPMPALILTGQIGKSRSDYHLFALTEPLTTRPNEQSLVGVAPLPNVDPNGGRICQGTQPFPHTIKGSVSATAGAAWHAFATSAFNHDLAQNKSKTHPHNIVEQWQELQDQGSDTYPLDTLVEYTLRNGKGCTLADVYRNLIS